MTTGWPWGVFTDHRLYTADGACTGRPGLDAWQTFLDDLESGYFASRETPRTKLIDNSPHVESAKEPPQVTVVCYQWREGYRDYLPEHVNICRRMHARHLRVPHRFVCITNETAGFDREVEIIRPTDEAMRLAKLKSPEGEQFPSSYRRLWVWSKEAASVLGPRILLTDVDVVLTGDITPLVKRTEDFVGWRARPWGNADRFIGGSYLLRAGSFPEVWERFIADPSAAIKEARAANYRGSDQAWISYCLRGRGLPHFPQHLIAYPGDFPSAVPAKTFPRGKWQPPKNKHAPLETPPQGAVMIQLCGHVKPWHIRDLSWVREHWR
jgi:hypothetical protein